MGIAHVKRLLGAAAAGGVLLLVACGGHAAGPSTSAADVSPANGPTVNAALSRIPSGDWTEFDYNARRSGVGPNDTGITAGDVKTLRRQRVHLDGTVDSSPIELHAVLVAGRRRDVIIVTTSYGRTTALDASTGRKVWEYVPSDIRGYEGSAQITTATPIANPNRRYVYAATPDGRIRKLRLSNGREVRSSHWPARITFDATHEKIASALNISGASVVAVTGGYIGDAPPYQGHVVLVDRSDGRVTHVWNSLCANRHDLIDPPSSCPASDSAIWGRAGAVIEPRTHRILVATGNAPFNGSTDWGDSVLELAPNVSHLLQNWTPTDQARLNATDADLGSTAPALLPETGGVRLAVQGGKDGDLHVLNLARLNGVTGHAGRRTGGEVQSIPAPDGQGVFTAPAVWTTHGDTYLFVANFAGTSAYRVSRGRRPRLHVAWHQALAGTSPVVAGGLLYVYDPTDGRLDVRRPATGSIVAALPAGTGHWNSPIVIGGRIVLPVGNANDHATSGTLNIYRLPRR